MIRTFRIAYALKNTYRVNGIIYSIKQIPLLRRILPETLYRVRGFKILANVLSGLWEAVSAFLGKLLYLLVMVFGVCALYEWIGLYENGSVGGVTESRVFLHIFFLLTVIGAYKNTYLFEPSNDKYYAISLMRMNARNYMVSYYGYMMLRLVVGFLPFTILLGRLCGVPLWICVLLPFFVAGGKLISVSLMLRRYEKTGKNPGESAFARWDWILVVLLLAAAYGLPALGIVIPDFLIVGMMILVTAAGLLSVKKVVDFPCYCQLCRQMLADQKQVMDVKVTSQNIVAEASRKKISRDTSITSNKKGLEYFNELFVKRHKKILWNSEKRITGICLILLAVAVGGCIFAPEFAKVINEGLMKFLPVFLFVMYLVNRGTTFTQALFINCDHSMLTYAFYKKPGTILKLFWIRLRELVKINLLSAVVIGGGLSLLLGISGGTQKPIQYVVLPVSILAMSVFFSVHYLAIYYLLQPYNAATEIRSGTYKLIVWVTYFFCYMMMQVRMDSLLFGGMMIGFALVYCIVAGILVYRLAGKTFRLRT